MEEEGMKSRSFRYEDSTYRRVFLRSYPLQWEQGNGREEEEELRATLKNKLIDIFHWGEDKVLLLRKIKNKVAFYVLTCHPFGFSSSNKMITDA